MRSMLAEVTIHNIRQKDMQKEYITSMQTSSKASHSITLMASNAYMKNM